MSNLLLEKAPDCIYIPREVPINTDFRIGIKFEQIMLNPDIETISKLTQSLELYLGDFSEFTPEEITEAVNQIMWFYSCGKQDLNLKDNVESKNSGVAKQVYDFDVDAPYIVAAFEEQYRIDLTSAQMHWWKFKALFDSLSERCEFSKIMGYRAVKITDDMTKSQKDFYKQMKKTYALKPLISKEEQLKMKALEEALLKGESLDGLL